MLLLDVSHDLRQELFRCLGDLRGYHVKCIPNAFSLLHIVLFVLGLMYSRVRSVE